MPSEKTVFPIAQRDSMWWYKLNGALRHAIVRGALNPVARPVVLTEYPKCGGTWLSQMLAHALDLPYARMRLPVVGPQVMHGCFLTVNRKLDTVVVWRDGRDAMVSYYYHSLVPKDIVSARETARMQKLLGVTDPADISAHLPQFMEWAFEGGYPRFTWSDFARRWHDDPRPAFTSYEALKADPARELRQVIGHFGRAGITDEKIAAAVETFTFKRQSEGRRPGQEDIGSFVRKGVVGDWKNVFDDECRRIFHHYAGEELKLLGYEENDDWVAEARPEAQ